MNKILRFNSHRLACLLFSLLSLTMLSGTRQGHTSESVDEVVKTKESAVSSLRFLKKSLGEYPDHRAELIAAALQTFEADEENQHRVIFVAREVFPDETTALAEELMLLSPDAVVSLRSAFLADTDAMRAALPESWADESDSINPAATSHLPLAATDEEPVSAETAIDIPQGIETASTFALPVHQSMIDPDTAVDTSFDLSGPKRASLPSTQDSSAKGSLEEAIRDQIKLPEASASADESSLNNALEFDETNESDLAKTSVRIDDAWKPSEEIYLDESKFEKRKLTTAQASALENPQERAELDFQSTVDYQASGFGPPPLDLPTINPEL